MGELSCDMIQTFFEWDEVDLFYITRISKAHSMYMFGLE